MERIVDISKVLARIPIKKPTLGSGPPVPPTLSRNCEAETELTIPTPKKTQKRAKSKKVAGDEKDDNKDTKRRRKKRKKRSTKRDTGRTNETEEADVTALATENDGESTGIYYVYILLLTNKNAKTVLHPKTKLPLTYIGQTNDLVNRLRQHNSIIAGGARYTTRWTNTVEKRQKYVWRHLCYTGDLTLRNALRLEKACKRNSKSLRRKHCAAAFINDRIQKAVIPLYALRNLFEALNMTRWTSKMTMTLPAMKRIRVRWCFLEHKPVESRYLFPDNIHEMVKTREDMQRMLKLPPNSRATDWVLDPSEFPPVIMSGSGLNTAK